MSTTKQTAPVGSWLRVSDDKENVLISHDSTSAIAVYVGSTAPDADSAFHRCPASRPFALSGVTGMDVYVRSLGTAAVDVTLTAV